MNKKFKAFTLLELIIILVINSILGTAIMFRISLSTANINKHSRISMPYAESEAEASFTFQE